MLCVWAPPSDQPTNSYVVPPLTCGDGALTDSVEPRIAVRVNGAVWVVEPPASVAVRRSSRCEGYSWSGATKLPFAVPAKVWSGCSWQVEGQCCITRDHESADAPSVPCWASLAWPENVMTSPTFQVVLAAGVSITAAGGVLPAEIVTDDVPLAPDGSVTRRPAVYVPGWAEG